MHDSVLRSAVTFSYVLVALLAQFSEGFALRLVPFVAAIAVLSMIERLKRGRISVLMVWEFGFLSLILQELWGSQGVLVQAYGLDTVGRASQLFFLGHAAVVLAAGLVSRKRPDAKVPSSKLDSIPGFIPLAAVSLASYAFSLPRAATAASLGRSAVMQDASQSSAVSALMQSGSLLLPALTTLYVCRRSGKSLWIAYLLISPLLVAQFLVGTRYVLLITALSPLFTYYGVVLRSARTVGTVAVAAVGLFIASEAMLTLRAGRNLDLKQLFDESGPSSEGVVKTVCQLILYFDEHVHLFGESLMSVVVFPIPREVWPDKPTLIGYWFPREFGLSGFGEAHSVSVGFVGDGYADFGLLGVLVYGALIGVGLGWAQRMVDRYLEGVAQSAWAAPTACLLPAAFFAVRSPVTTLVAVVGLLFWTLAAKSLESLVQAKDIRSMK